MSWFKRVLLSKNFWLSRREEMGPAQERSITVVIPAYNEEHSIAKTIESIKVQSVKVDRIIVVDDHSSDNTSAVAIAAGAEVIRAEKNSGTKAQALNLAIPHITTELMACVDADTELKYDAIEKTLPYFNSEDTGVVCGFVIPKNSHTMWERGRLLEYLCACSINKDAQERIHSVMVASGCFMVVPTKLLHQMGGYDPRTMAEDMDLTWQCVDLGYLVRFARDAVCYVVDPHCYDIYDKQVSRWQRGFLQNIKIRNFKLFENTPRMRAVVWFYFLMAIIGPAMLPITLWLAITGNALYFITWLLILYSVIVWIPGIVEGLRQGFSFPKLISCVPCQLVTQYTNMYIFIRSLVQEFFLGQTLRTWNKGH